MTDGANDLRGAFWRAMGDGAIAHVIMLRDAGIMDTEAMEALLPAVATARDGSPPELPIAQLGAIFDQRIDANAVQGVVGAASVGRGTIDLMATASRIVLRDQMLKQIDELDALRGEMEAFTDSHAVTMMPAFSVSAVAQSTSLGHISSALVTTLERASDSLWTAFAMTNRSPLGAGALAGTGFPTDRSRSAELVGFDGVIDQTYDAVSSSDHFHALADAIDRIAVPVARWLDELTVWIRTDPSALTLDESWSLTDPSVPQWSAPGGIAALAAHARRTSGDAATLRSTVAHLPWGPVAGELGTLHAAANLAMTNCSVLMERSIALMKDALFVNRAYFANRAGRSLVTISDLVDFLMVEEQLDPAAARAITSITLTRMRESGIESSGITAEMLDTAAMMTIGRELKVEFEAISRYLAPRRFVERRNVTGGPAPSAVRSWLAGATERRRADEARLAIARREISTASQLRNAAINEAISPEG